MKKHLSLLLRILFAAAGVGYIALTLTWSDSIVVPAGVVLPNGVTPVKPMPFKVIEGDIIDKEGKLVVQLDEKTTMEVDRAKLGAEVTDYRAKPGVPTTLAHAKVPLLLLGLLIVGPIYIVQSYRWWLLMRARGLDCTLWKSFRLTMIGSFFNYCMPGTTGGDLVKAYYSAKNSDRRADSVMTVVVDRVTGLLGLVVMAGVAGLFMIAATSAGWLELSEKQTKVVNSITGFIWLGMAIGAVFTAVYFSSRIRRVIIVPIKLTVTHYLKLFQRKLGIPQRWVDKVTGRKGIFDKLDAAALAYKKHIGVMFAAVALSLPVHLALSGATAMAGYALGIESPLGLLLTVVPVLFLAAAVPLTYQGLGVMEGLAMALILSTTASENQIVGMLLMIRFYQIFYSLLGSLFLLRGDIHMHPEREAEAPAVAEATPMNANAAAA